MTISLTLQHAVGPIWLDMSGRCDGHDDREDSAELACYWLAEVYAGVYPVREIGPYRVRIFDDAGPWESVVTRDHVLMNRMEEQVTEDERERAVDARAR